MNQMLISMFIFCIVLFFYLHIQFHLKKGNDLEIFEVDQVSKDRMEEICDFRQPVLFDLEEDQYTISKNTRKDVLLEKYPVFEIKIRENNSDNLYVPLQLSKAVKLFKDDKTANYFSENNSDFLLETGIVKMIEQFDEFLRPVFVSQCLYDILIASENTTTPFRYHVNYRNYYMVTQGSMQIKLSPPKSDKYLYCENDYENFEFKSPVNPWKPQKRFQDDFDKIKCLDVTLVPGKCFCIPAYWWYSFKFSSNTSVTSLCYRTYMNTISILPQIAMYYLQNQNVQHQVLKKMNITNAKDITPLSNEDNDNDKNKEKDDDVKQEEPKENIELEMI